MKERGTKRERERERGPSKAIFQSSQNQNKGQRQQASQVFYFWAFSNFWDSKNEIEKFSAKIATGAKLNFRNEFAVGVVVVVVVDIVDVVVAVVVVGVVVDVVGAIVDVVGIGVGRWRIISCCTKLPNHR